MKRTKKEKKKIVSEATIARNTRKQVAAVLLAGLALMAADLIMSSTQEQVTVTEDGGTLYITRPPAGGEPGHLTLRAEVHGEEETLEQKLEVTMEPYSREKESEEATAENAESGVSEREQMEMELRGIATDLNSDTDRMRIMLPSRLETGERISWEAETASRSNAVAILAMTGIVAFFVYRNRFTVLEKQRKKEYESVMRQLPEFVNRLVLLLNAGLVLTNAFEKSMEERFSDRNEDDYFYGRLKSIYVSCRTANGSMHTEFRRMAKESGIRELMRVSNIMTDNIRKGVELTDKLRSESEMLWLERKKSCEERGRLAETKLTLPLMIFLMVLLIITVAPAFLEL